MTSIKSNEIILNCYKKISGSTCFLPVFQVKIMKYCSTVRKQDSATQKAFMGRSNTLLLHLFPSVPLPPPTESIIV